MKAVQINEYGDIDVIQVVKDAPMPGINPDQVLVEVHAASLNPVDWKLRGGYMKERMPLRFPATLGGDFSGVVKKVGEQVKDYFKEEDEVYGQAAILTGGSGTLAEYVAAKASSICLKPKNFSHSEAAALPMVGVSALQALQEGIRLTKGQKILIHGGAGGIGSIAIQIAKHIGAYVATTVSFDDIEYAKSLGADEVLDYKKQNFEEVLRDYDAVLDTVGGETYRRSFNILKKGGILVSLLERPDQETAARHGVHAVLQMTHVTTDRLSRVTELVESGAVRVQIDEVFTSLEESGQAFDYLENRHPRGKVVERIR